MRALYITSWLLFFSIPSFSQHLDSLAEQIPSRAGDYVRELDNKLSYIRIKLEKQTVKYLKKITAKGGKIISGLKKPGVADSSLFNFPGIFQSLSNGIRPEAIKGLPGKYIPWLDSISVSLHFLERAGMKGVENSIEHLKGLQNSFQNAEKIKVFLDQRAAELEQYISRLTRMPGKLNNYFKKYSKTLYYYSEQVKEFKQLLNDPGKIERKILSQLNKLPAFRQFLQQNSQLASLFRQENSTRPLDGLQARREVQADINTRVSFGGAGSAEMVQANLAEAHTRVNNIKDAIINTGQGNIDVPGIEKFKPDDLKTKPFLKRLELGTSLHSQRSKYYLPAATDIGMTLGYKMNQKSIIGFGLSYKFSVHRSGLHQEGAGVRSFMDWKIKRSFFLSGGYEKQFLSLANSPNSIADGHSWQTSGLIGFTAKYKISKKITGNVQLLWDFLSYKNIPVSQPLIYRIGYSLK